MNRPASGPQSGYSGRAAKPLGLALVFILTPLAALLIQTSALGNEACLRGTDAYYYALQADSWFKTGQVRIPDNSPLHPLIGSLMSGGLDGESAVRAWLGLSLALFCAAFYALAPGRSFRPLELPALILWPLLSPSLMFCAIEFPKTFAFTIAFTLGLAAARPGWRWRLLMLGFFALACLLHRMALVNILAALAGLLAFWGWGQDELKRLISRPWVKAGIALAVMAALSLLLFNSPAATELSRLSGQRLSPGALALFLEPNLPTAVRIELILSALILMGLIVKNDHGRRGSFLALGLAAPAFIPAFGTEPFSLGERFGLLLPLLTALAWVLLRPPRKEAEAGAVRSGPGQNPARRALGWALVLVLALAGSLVRPEYSYPSRLNLPCLQYARLTRALEGLNPPMLIAHRDFHFYYKYHTGREAFSYEPEKHWPRDRVWRLLYGVSPTELQAYLPPERGWRDSTVLLLPGTPYSLVREDVYEPFRASVDRSYNPELYDLLWSSVMNPSEPRPAFLYKKHRTDEDDEFSALP